MSEEKQKAQGPGTELSDTDLQKVSGGQTINPASPAGTGQIGVDDAGTTDIKNTSILNPMNP